MKLAGPTSTAKFWGVLGGFGGLELRGLGFRGFWGLELRGLGGFGL